VSENHSHGNGPPSDDDPRRGTSEQSLSDADQTASDTDQTASDVDQASADRDQRSSAIDERASEADAAASSEDQRQADLDHRSRGAEGSAVDAEYEAERAGRETRALGRRVASTDRGLAATARDRTGHDRDETAGARDATSGARDARADLREAHIEEIADTLAKVNPELASRFEALRAQAAADRARAATDRARAASARAGAARDRARLEGELQMAHLDLLTGAYRREMGLQALEHEIARARRSDGGFVVAFVDVDNLKAINDRDGHAAGDRALQAVVKAIRARLRSFDPIIRFGGDEFVCGLGGTHVVEAEQRFATIARGLTEDAGVGISVGLAPLIAGDTVEQLIARADQALLAAKRERGSARGNAS
jgi:diguanylate cyclase (GGDEF)-like protein